MKNLKLYSFFFCFVLVFYTFPACSFAQNFVDYFFGNSDILHSSFSQNLPQIRGTDETKQKSQPDEYINLTLYVIIAFNHNNKVVYYPSVTKSFNMTHINTKTKLAKFRKRIKESFPNGMYDLQTADFVKIDVAANGVHMEPEDNLDTFIQKSGIKSVNPVPVLLIVHPTDKWVHDFFLKELNRDYANAEKEFHEEKKLIGKDLRKFFDSLNLSEMIFFKSEDLNEKTIKNICNKAEDKFLNEKVKIIINAKCNEVRQRFEKAQQKLLSRMHYLQSLKNNHLR